MSDRSAIIAAHRAGMPMSRISSALGVPLSEVHDAIVDFWANGAAREPRTSGRDVAEMMALHDGGMTWHEVGERFGLTGDTVRQRVAAWRKWRDE